MTARCSTRGMQIYCRTYTCAGARCRSFQWSRHQRAHTAHDVTATRPHPVQQTLLQLSRTHAPLGSALTPPQNHREASVSMHVPAACGATTTLRDAAVSQDLIEHTHIHARALSSVYRYSYVRTYSAILILEFVQKHSCLPPQKYSEKARADRMGSE